MSGFFRLPAEMPHQHLALSDPAVPAHAAWHFENPESRLMMTLIRRLCRKPYAHRVACFWAMHEFKIAGPMKWTGQMFEGEASSFICIRETKGDLITVSFHSLAGGETPPATANVDESEKIVDALVLRIPYTQENHPPAV